MKDSKLIQILHSIQPDELHWLAKWVRSPYYNTNPLVADLYDLLRTFAPTFEGKALTKEKVFQKLFPGKKYDDRRLRLLMHKLTELTADFLVAQRLKRESDQRDRLLYAELGQRNQYQLFEQQKEKIVQALQKKSFRDEDYYWQKWKLEFEHFSHPQSSRLGWSNGKMADMMQDLDAFFVLSKIRYSTELQNRHNILSEEHQLNLLEESRTLAEKHPGFGQDLVFQTYLNLLQLIEAPQEEAIFAKLEQSALTKLDLFSESFQASLIRYMINTTILLYQRGKRLFLEKQFSLYQIGLDRSLFLEEGLLSDATFLNIIITAITLHKLDWAENFVTTFQDKLALDKRDDATSLGLAYLRFAQRDFPQTNRLLMSIQTETLHYQLRVRSLSLRNYYERFLLDPDDYSIVVNQSQNFEKYLSRNQPMSADRLEAYRNFCRMVRNLTYRVSRLETTEAHLQKLKDFLENNDHVIAKDWLHQKVAALADS
ncbi:MAG: hypothetical protein AAF206_11800 [Bacteroidota bacterium]